MIKAYKYRRYVKNAVFIIAFIYISWYWLFGALQPRRNEVKIVYGITQKPDATDFMDFYSGEFTTRNYLCKKKSIAV